MPRSRATGKTTKSTKPRSFAKKTSKTSPSNHDEAARSLGKAVLSVEDIFQNLTSEIDFDENSIATYQELIAALDAHVTQITLGSNIITEDNITVNYDVVINFNGFSIISSETHSAARVIDIRSGEVTLTGRGKIFAMGKNSVAIRAFGAISTGVPKYTTITIDEGIELYAPDSYGILISPNLGVAYGLTIDLAGRIFAHDGICIASSVRGYDVNAPVINIKNNAGIIADETSGVTIEASGYGKWHIASAYLRGATGLNLTTGIISCSQSQIIAEAGECFRILENPDSMLEVNLDGGNYVSTNSHIIAGEPKTTKKFSAKNCTFCSPGAAISTAFSKVIKAKKVNIDDNVEKILSSMSINSDQAAADETEKLLEAAFAEPEEFETPTMESELVPETQGITETPSNLTDPQRSPVTTEESAAVDFDAEESEIEAALQREIDALDAEEFNDISTLLDEPTEPPQLQKPKKTKKPKKTRKQKTSKLKRQKAPAPQPLLLLDVAELSDDATDEQAILLELTGEAPEPEHTLVQKSSRVSPKNAGEAPEHISASTLAPAPISPQPTATLTPSLSQPVPSRQDIAQTQSASTPILQVSAPAQSSQPSVPILQASTTAQPLVTAIIDPAIQAPFLAPAPNPALPFTDDYSFAASYDVQPAPEPVLPFTGEPNAARRTEASGQSELTSEQDAARRALTDAIYDIRKLSSEDYDTGFSELEQAIQQAEQTLAAPFASLSEIHDAADTLLQAFDDLEERDDTLSMSDAELDELFYHGAVLQEMLKETKKDRISKPRKRHQKHPKILPETPQLATTGMSDLLSEIIKHQQNQPNLPQPQVALTEENPNLIPDFSSLSAVLARIAELDLNSYTLASQENLLKTLSVAQTTLNDSKTTQHMVNHLATQLSAEILQLVPLRQSYSSASTYRAQLSAPAPIIGATMASTMIDEMSPTTIWSLGVTMIDEMTPFTIDASIREKILFNTQSKLSQIKTSIRKPFAKLSKSLTAGLRAGIRAYKETLHTTLN